MELTESFETLADAVTVEMIATLGAGYMAGTLLKNTIEGRTDLDVPDEAYGIAVAGGAGYLLDGDYAKHAIIGGGLYTGDKLAERIGIKSRIESVGGN